MLRSRSVGKLWSARRCQKYVSGVTCSLPEHVDVIVVGGGVSGISAARVAAKRGCRVLVLEARNRLGGRVLSVLDGSADLGATWAWPEDECLWAATRAAGCELEPQFGMMVGTPGQRYRFAGGASRFVAGLAGTLPADAVAVGRPVTSILRRNGGVKLRLADGAAVSASAAVLALPPQLAQELQHIPALPSELVQEMRAQPTFYGTVTKACLTYDGLFWREDAEKGTLPTDHIAYELYDSSSSTGDKPCLGAFLATTPDHVPEYVIKDHLLSLLEGRYGVLAQNPTGFAVTSWAHETFTTFDPKQPRDAMPTVRPLLGEAIDQVLFLASTEASADARTIGKLNSAVLAGEVAGAAAADRILNPYFAERVS